MKESRRYIRRWYLNGDGTLTHLCEGAEHYHKLVDNRCINCNEEPPMDIFVVSRKLALDGDYRVLEADELSIVKPVRIKV